MPRTARKATIPYLSPYRHGFVRVAACVPTICIADPKDNAARHLEMVRKGHDEAVALMVFPELGISAYAIDDLLLQDVLLEAVDAAITTLVEGSKGMFPAFVVGAPLRCGGRLFNCAVVIHDGEILGVVPKSFLPNYREFYERRWFASGLGVLGELIEVAGRTVPFGTDLLFRSTGTCGFTFHTEVCEDYWMPCPPSSRAAMAGAEILLNLSASNIVIGKAEARKLLSASQSMRCQAAYLYSAAGPGESTTDMAWDGQASIHELGVQLAETPRFPTQSCWTTADVDVGRIRGERLRMGSFGDAVAADAAESPGFRIVDFRLDAPTRELELRRDVERYPFAPNDPARLAEECYEAYNIQVQGLAQRLKATGFEKLVIGVSGGLDSTHALIVAARAMDSLGLPRTHVLGYTMPGFATSDFTRSNAWKLMRALGVSAAELDIRPAANQMLADLGHPFAKGEAVYDVTFENVQAGLRTDYLFRLANQQGALVVGTGDLSELALGWCTYGVGDHMSHYNVNASVSKTLIQHLIRFVAGSGDVGPEASAVLLDVLETEISPELIPAKDGEIQSTEDRIGPYALQDFNLYYLARFGMAPSKIAYLALQAWGDADRGDWPADTPPADRRSYSLEEIRRWLRLFLVRFFANQFKRSCLPNGPKISSGGSLSPRADWRMPSDARADAWVEELETNI